MNRRNAVLAFCLALCSLLLATAAGCATPPPNSLSLAAPLPADAPLARPAESHPYLLFRQSDLPRMRQAIEQVPHAKAVWQNLLKWTDPATKIVLPEPGCMTQERGRAAGSPASWVDFVYRMSPVAGRCGFIYQMNGDRRYADWARRFLLECAREFRTRVNFQLCADYVNTEIGHQGEGGNTMGYYHSGALLTNAALAYDCIYETLTPEERRTIEEDFFRQFVGVLDGYDFSRHMIGQAPDFMVGGGQWNGANMCNMGLAAVGFVLGDRRLYERSVRNFKLYLGRDMLSDGFWVEEDRAYSDTCVRTLFMIAWMARSSGYGEDLFQAVVQAEPSAAYDRRYVNSLVSCDGPCPPERSLKSYLDAQIDYQYPTLGDGNWGWTPGRGSLKTSGSLIGMYDAGYALYGEPAYGFLLSQVDRATASLDLAGLSPIYFARPLGDAPPPESRSRWYPHGRWLVLKSLEGAGYWQSDSLYAFMPYGTERSKGLEPLTLDLFAFGRVMAPRTAIAGQAQNLTMDYQLNEPCWNTVLVDGRNMSYFSCRADRAWLAYHNFSPLLKVAAARVHLRGERHTELQTPAVERHPEEDRTAGRTLAMTDRYLVDVYHITYDRRPKYKHNFDYVLHGAGKLTLEGLRGQAPQQQGDWSAVWKQEDGVALRSTFLSAEPRGGTKAKTFSNSRGEFVVATRAGYDGWFIVVHEPFRREPQIVGLRRLISEPDQVGLEIRLRDGAVDLINLRTKPHDPADAKEQVLPRGGAALAPTENYRYVRTLADGRQETLTDGPAVGGAAKK